MTIQTDAKEMTSSLKKVTLFHLFYQYLPHNVLSP